MPGSSSLPDHRHVTNRGQSNDGADHATPSSAPISLQFMDVCYRVQVESKSTGSGVTRQGSRRERTVLHGVTGKASPGEILVVLGPSGSGKSTLLNALAGRLHGHSLTGSILANGSRPTASVMRRTGFVAQDDVLYPHLTVRETLVYCALLRLPVTVPREEKVAAAESVMSQLGLSACGSTVIGNGFIRGVSGGERKRVSIAHEMLMNPSLLILDEPTSGLDSTAAFRLAETLAGVANKGGKTVVASMHQPSSRLYQLLDSVLLLSQGKSLYFGKANQALSYFESVRFPLPFPMNPADFLLDLANGVYQLGSSSTDKETPNIRQTLISSYNHHLAPQVTAFCSATNPPSDIVMDGKRGPTRPTRLASISTWLSHFTILLSRSLKERRHESFNSLRVLQVICAALLSGAMWWRSDPLDVQDRLGLLFFLSIFWGVIPSFNAAFAFPQDRAIFLKERASRIYTLSPYFMARVVGDLPMELILPTISLSLTYWMSGLRPKPDTFILTLGIVLGYVLVAGGLGLAIGAVVMDAKRASTVVTITMLAFILTGGYYVHKLPACFEWVKYLSTTFYCYRLLIYAQYGEGYGVWNELGCAHAQHGSNLDGSCKFMEQDVFGQIRPVFCLGILGIMFFGFRMVAYLALRRVRC